MKRSLPKLFALALCLLLPAGAGARNSLELVRSFDPAQGELPESIALDDDGNIFMSMGSTIRKLTPDGAFSTYATLPIPVFALGLKVGPDGCVYLASTSLDPTIAGAYVWRSCSEGDIEVYAELDHTGGPNDVAFDDDGNLFVTDPTLAQVWKITPDGEAAVWVSDPLFAGNPNDPALILAPFGVDGLAFDKQQRNLYVGNLDYGYIIRIGVERNGEAGEVELFADDPALVGADGIAFDISGKLYVTSGSQNQVLKVDRRGRVSVVAEGGLLDGPSSVAFGTTKKDKHTLYIANLSFLKGFGILPGTPYPSIVSMEVRPKGLPLP